MRAQSLTVHPLREMNSEFSEVVEEATDGEAIMATYVGVAIQLQVTFELSSFRGFCWPRHAYDSDVDLDFIIIRH